MSRRRSFLAAISYLDDVINLLAAVSGYAVHQDESIFADDVMDIVEQLLEEQGVDTGDVDVDKVREGLVMVIDGLEGVF